MDAAKYQKSQKTLGRRESRVKDIQNSSHSRFDSASQGYGRSKNALQSSSVYGHSSQRGMRPSHSSRATIPGGAAGGVAGGVPAPVQVLDEEGNDVTPLSLVAAAQGGVGRHKQHAAGVSTTDMQSMATATRETVADVLNNLESMTAGSWGTSVFGKSMMSYSNSSRASGASTPEEKDGDDAGSVGSAESIEEREDGEGAMRTKEGAEGVKTVTEADLNKLVHMNLVETDNILLFEVAAISVSSDSAQETESVKAANARYKELKSTRANNENYVDRGMQTFNEPLKNKDVQAAGQKHANAECMTTQWEIYDAYHPSESAAHADAANTGEPRAKEADIEALQSMDMGGSTALSGALADSSHPSNQSKLASGLDMTSGTVGPGSRSVFVGDDTVSEYASVGPGANAPGDREEKSEMAVLGAESLTLNSLNQSNLRNSLLIMERAIVGNTYEKKLMEFRNITEAGKDDEKRGAGRDAKAEEGVEGGAIAAGAGLDDSTSEIAREEKKEVDRIPTLQFLWSYRCELTRGRCVMYMAWNKQNEDILAVAYGDCKASPQSPPGLVLCWSLKNPEWPERVYRTKSCVTAIDFSRSNPNLLACGYMDGRLAIYDVRRKDDKPVLDTNDLGGKHRDPVWELKWVERERDEQSRGETLVSVSTDGRVTQWLIRKGLEYTDLMSLKRVTKQQERKGGAGPAGTGGGGGAAAGAIKTSAFIARQAGGLCFDFNPKDSNTLDPAILHSVLDRQLTSMIFASRSPAILTGDDNGAVNVYKLRRVGTLPGSETGADLLSPEDQAKLLASVMASKNQNQGQGVPGQGGQGTAGSVPPPA
ncbi:WD repeat-containing protein 78 [Borealophlyctis nickersoniae]|nr:WD repeat-containing protein 78 [Borealophlyctis nickersoniae]